MGILRRDPGQKQLAQGRTVENIVARMAHTGHIGIFFSGDATLEQNPFYFYFFTRRLQLSA